MLGCCAATLHLPSTAPPHRALPPGQSSGTHVAHAAAGQRLPGCPQQRRCGRQGRAGADTARTGHAGHLGRAHAPLGVSAVCGGLHSAICPDRAAASVLLGGDGRGRRCAHAHGFARPTPPQGEGHVLTLVRQWGSSPPDCGPLTAAQGTSILMERLPAPCAKLLPAVLHPSLPCGLQILAICRWSPNCLRLHGLAEPSTLRSPRLFSCHCSFSRLQGCDATDA